MINWRDDTEKRLNNLLRFIVQDVEARGDASALLDEPSVTQNDDGSYTVEVFHPPSKSPPASQGETSGRKKKTTSKKKSSTSSKRNSSDDDED